MKEPKYQILKPTGCYVGGHVWTWTSAGDRQSEPPAGKRCNCGEFTWAERDKAGKEADCVQPAGE